MNAPEMHAMTNCPNDEILALFVEGKLKGAEREAVVEHLDACADCRDIVVDATEEAAAAAARPNVVPLRRVLPWVAAVAAGLVLVFATPLGNRIFQDDLTRLNRDFTMRQTEGRISIERGHKAYVGRLRNDKQQVEARAPIKAMEASARAEKNPTQENLHKAGLALLLARKPSEAIPMLERALSMGESVELLNDTAAAHLETVQPRNLTRAVELSARSLGIERTPAALWNRALALEYLERYPEARKAWQEYIAAEPDPAWDQEALSNIARIQGN